MPGCQPRASGGASRLTPRAAESRPGGDALAGLAEVLAARGVSLEAPPEARGWHPGIRRLAIAVGLAATDLAAPRARVVLARAGATLSATVTPATEQGDGPGIALARRLAEGDGGRFAIRRDGETAVVSAAFSEATEEIRRSA